jgi:hypothetical protein
MKILDMSAGNRAVWFDKAYRDAVYVDLRVEVKPDVVADTRKLPDSIGSGYGLIVFDPPHVNASFCETRHASLMWPYWEPLFGHATASRTKHSCQTQWVMLRRRSNPEAPYGQ